MTDAHGIDWIRRRYVLLLVLRWLPTAFLVPVLILVFQEAGLSLGQIGVVIAVYSTLIVVLELPTGGLADALGARPVLALASFLDVVGTMLLLLARSMPGLVAAGALMGIARALASGPLEAWFVSATRRVNPIAGIRSGLARGEAVSGIAMAVGALAAGFFPKVLTGAGLLAPLRLPVLVAVVLGVVRLGATLALVDPAVRPRSARATTEIRRVPGIVREAGALIGGSGDLRSLVGAAVAIGFSLATFEFLWQPRLAELVADIESKTELLGIAAAGIFVTASMGSALVPWWTRRCRQRPARAAAVATALSGAVGVICSLTTSPVGMIIGVLGVYFAFGLVSPLKQELLHESVGHDHRTTVVSANSLGVQGGNLVTQLAMMPLAGAVGIPRVWLIAGVVLALSAGLYQSVGSGFSVHPAPAP